MRLIILLLSFMILPVQAAQLAGEITASMGDAQILSATQVSAVATQGMTLNVGDTLITGANGHLHLRMVDDALVSLRPNGQLKISRYSYQLNAPAATQIQLDLRYGTARSVTGQGGHLAKDKFRMNTPLAAIGVRGTDFIAQADEQKTLVQVASGAIVLAPIGVGCQATSLGSCQTDTARLLTAEMRDLMLEMSRGMKEPRFVPISDKLPLSDATSLKPQLATTATLSELPAQGDTPKNLTLISKAATNLSNAATNSTNGAPTHYQMVWGHWSWLTPGSVPGAIPMFDAAQGREVTVGNNFGALFRDTNLPMLLPQSGQAALQLRSGQVTMVQAGVNTAGQVTGGALGLDFNVMTFNTQLNVQHPLTGSVALNSAGRIRDDGLLLPNAGLSNGTILGSLSRDAREAGYLFDLPTAAGTLSGTTLWVQ